MIRMSLALALLAGISGMDAAAAATLKNTGSKAVVVQVADSSGRMNVSIEPGASEDVCPSGCFVTLPNGDRLGLGGSETVDIHDGTASVQ